MDLWEKYFPGQSLPIVYYYTDEKPEIQAESGAKENCIVCDIKPVLAGKQCFFDKSTIRCNGARRYLGFSQKTSLNFKYFLSCGIEGSMEGERYKKSPDLVEKWLENNPPLKAPGEYIVFKRIDQILPDDKPLAVSFFAGPDVLSGLFTLAGFDQERSDAVITPFGSGCASIVYYPLREIDSGRERVVLGMFDVSARPCVQKDQLTFTISWEHFIRMVENMEESFLITSSWRVVRDRLS